jgi:hypothetical protein
VKRWGKYSFLLRNPFHTPKAYFTNPLRDLFHRTLDVSLRLDVKFLPYGKSEISLRDVKGRRLVNDCAVNLEVARTL